MVLKKIMAIVTTVFLVSSCNMNLSNNNTIESTSSNKLKGFSIKSTTNPNEIKKNFLPITRLSKQKGKDEDEKDFKFNFVTTSQDLKRSFILNIINGADGLNKVGNIEVKVNGTTIIWNHDEDLNDIDDIAKITKKLCKDTHSDDDSNDKKEKNKVNRSKTTPDCSILLNNFFNRKTDSLSASMWNIKEGNNILEVKIKDERNKFGLDISVDGFLKPFDIPNAHHSRVPDDQFIRSSSSYYHNGKIKIKFLEGMKVNLNTGLNEINKLVSQDGTNLTSLERLVKSFNIEKVYKLTGLSQEEADKEEKESEAFFNADIPNLGLFYVLKFNESVDIWKVIDELRKLPFVEEAYPDFVFKSSGYTTNDTYLNPPENAHNREGWLTTTGIKTVCPYSIGAWEYNRGKGVKIAIIDGGAKSSQQGLSPNGALTELIIKDSANNSAKPNNITHEDFLDPYGNTPKNISYLNNILPSSLQSKTLSSRNLNHGTEILGLLGAVPNNNKGIAGIANESDIVSIMSINDDNIKNEDCACYGEGHSKDTSCNLYIDSILLAKKQGVKIINMSSGTPYGTIEVDPAIRTVISNTTKDGISVFIPAGNFPCDSERDELTKYICLLARPNGVDLTSFNLLNNTTWYVLGMYDTGSIIVGGLNIEGTKRIEGTIEALGQNLNTKFSYGRSKDYNSSTKLYGTHGVDISAPAELVYVPSYTKDYDFTGIGSSLSSPIVAGIGALLLSAKPSLTPLELRQALIKGERKDNVDNNEIPGMIDAYKVLKDELGYDAPNPCFTTKSIKNSAGNDVPVVTYGSKTEIKSGDQFAIPITPSIKDQLNNVFLGGIQVTLLEIVQNYAIYGVPNLGESSYNATTRLIDIVIKNNLGQTVETLADALKILLDAINQVRKFPDSVTVNGVTTKLDYGIKLEFNEGSGNTVSDSSGNNNTAEFVSRTTSDALPKWVNDPVYGYGVNFTDSPNGALRVKDDDSYEPGLKKDAYGNYQKNGKSTIIVIVKNDQNQATEPYGFLYKWSRINYMLDSYGIFQYGNNVSYDIYNGDNGYQYFEGESIDFFNDNGTNPIRVVSASLDLDNDNFVMMKNSVEVPFKQYDNGSNIYGPQYIQNSPLDLFIGNVIHDNNDWTGGYSGYKGTIYGMAIIKQALTKEQIQEVVKSMGYSN